MKNVRSFTVTSGNWTDGNNYTGYTLTGEVDRIHFPEKLLLAYGIKAGDTVKTPFECMAGEKLIQPRWRNPETGEYEKNKDGSWRLQFNEDGTPTMVPRIQATAYFPDKLAKAKVFAQSSDALFDAMVKSEVGKLAEDAGLDLKDIGIIVDASVVEE